MATFKTMENLIESINMAQEISFKYFAIKVEMDGFPEEEVIINPMINAVEKIDYYKNTYNDDLTHKHAKGIRIVDYTYADTYEDIESDFMVDLYFDDVFDEDFEDFIDEDEE